eukprot:4997998-Pyramimonas_sp.AAC.1
MADSKAMAPIASAAQVAMGMAGEGRLQHAALFVYPGAPSALERWVSDISRGIEGSQEHDRGRPSSDHD